MGITQLTSTKLSNRDPPRAERSFIKYLFISACQERKLTTILSNLWKPPLEIRLLLTLTRKGLTNRHY